MNRDRERLADLGRRIAEAKARHGLTYRELLARRVAQQYRAADSLLIEGYAQLLNKLTKAAAKL